MWGKCKMHKTEECYLSYPNILEGWTFFERKDVFLLFIQQNVVFGIGRPKVFDEPNFFGHM